MKVWGRTPDSDSHQVVIQRKVKGDWKTVKTLKADSYGIFRLRWRSSDRTHSYRARTDSGATSNGFSLKKPRSISLPNTWGCGGTIRCR